jgi:hypothetical protein
VLVRLDHIASFIVNANHGMMRRLKNVVQLAADMQPVRAYAREGQLGESVIAIETPSDACRDCPDTHKAN